MKHKDFKAKLLNKPGVKKAYDSMGKEFLLFESVNNLKFRVIWSEEDQEWVGLCSTFPSLSWLDEDKVKALSGIMRLVADVIDDLDDDELHVLNISVTADKDYDGNEIKKC